MNASVNPSSEPSRSRARDVKLRPMQRADLPYVVREHRVHFPGGFFARLGPGFLTAYYGSYAFSDGAHAYIAEAQGRTIGFLVGVTDPAAHRRNMLRRHRRSLLLRGLVALSLRPRLAASFLRTRATRYGRALLRQGVTRAPDTREPSARVAVLAHVAVAQAEQSQGAGSALVEQFLKDAASADCELVTLVTLSDPPGAREYYSRRGWQECGEHEDGDKRRLTTFEWRFDNSSA